jgi:hypothetical protein
VIQQSREVSRSLDYVETRADLDRTRIAYLRVSQGAVYGVIFTALDDRFRAVVFLDSGYFLCKITQTGFQRPAIGSALVAWPSAGSSSRARLSLARL